MNIELRKIIPKDRKQKYIASDLGVKLGTFQTYWYGTTPLPVDIAKKVIDYMDRWYNVKLDLDEIYSEKYQK